MNDWCLLSEYVEKRSETAFEELVRRHVNMVYGTALRQVGDTGIAEDVAQAVFVLLARKAEKITPSTLIAGWLYRTTNFAAHHAIREKLRRQRKERICASMTESPT